MRSRSLSAYAFIKWLIACSGVLASSFFELEHALMEAAKTVVAKSRYENFLIVYFSLPAKVSGGEAVRLTAELDPRAKRERPALKMCAAQEKPLGHESGAALQEG